MLLKLDPDVTSLDPRLHAFRPDLADERLRGRVDAPRFTTGVPRQVVAPSVPLCRRPVPDAPIDTEVLMGEGAIVFDEANGFGWVQLEGDCYVGYVPAEALGPAGAAPTHRVASLRTFLYPGPNMKLPPLGHLSLGAGVTPADTEGDFVRIASGAWLFARHLAPSNHPEPDFVAVAERLVGAPYLWGGKTSLGLDCSGLVQLSLGMAGIAAPRDTDMQAGALGREIEVDRASLRRGDLVFWKGHVGIMQDGGRLLHANGHHMAVASEPLADAEARIHRNSFGPITGVRRLPALSQPA